ncbi:thiamine ABC transporter substrate-binding protein [Neisseria animalis]|uniref:Thiamine ABC transporter substrate-binding protein n=1 Tax=Neisseria animalis TaxID=492 RepID=A0A5P3MT80_NEIAN|nr:thiamine ABC transporter substrate-binding protein [Neisseria animalis]QEY23849.1 thiamine ABC transporter substrate-binding protein [Neisseria animalis]ROW32083.1 thiamine ABC transporter substrate-binding protein [Neisseria animalis]VEE05700.1 putative solute-binding periplasmic protein [Neisseria animalis]
MKRKLLAGLAVLFAAAGAWAQTEVRLAVHGSFSLPDQALAAFERQHDAKVAVIKVGSGNEMINKLILSKAKPIADAVYGLDNAGIGKARQAGILAAGQPRSRPLDAAMPAIPAVDYAYVVLNYDKKWFERHKLPLPRSLQDLTKPQYKNLLVTPSPTTSSPGLAFLLANIGGMGEEGAFKWWAAMRGNGVKIAKSWSDAYYTDFTHNGGAYPLIVSYATSPAAEVFYSKGKYSEPPTGNLFLKGGVFRQVEGAAVLNGAKQPELAAKLVQWLQSKEVQQAIPSEMWVYPAVKGTPLPEVFKFARIPESSDSPSRAEIDSKQKQWISRWAKTVLR